MQKVRVFINRSNSIWIEKTKVKNQTNQKIGKSNFFIGFDRILDLVLKADSNQTYIFVYIFIHKFIISLISIFLLYIYKIII